MTCNVAYTSLKAMINGKNDKAVNVFVCFDNEEVGSGTKQGACSTFLYDTLQRINDNLSFCERRLLSCCRKKLYGIL